MTPTFGLGIPVGILPLFFFSLPRMFTEQALYIRFVGGKPGGTAFILNLLIPPPSNMVAILHLGGGSHLDPTPLS